MSTKSIRRKLLSTLIPILLLAIIINSVIHIVTFREYYSIALNEKSYTIAQSIRGTISRNLDFFSLESFPGMRQYLQHVLTDNNGISYAFVTDDELQILYHNDETHVGRTLEKRHYPRLNPDSEITISLDTYYESIIPIVEDDEVIGSIHVGVEKSIINQRTNWMLFQSLSVLLVAAIVSGYAVYYFLSNIVITPLSELSETVAYISTNKSFDRQVAVEHHDEIGKLAITFNEMIVNLREHYTALETKTAELRAAQKELEQINENLAINEKKYRSLFEDSNDTIFITTPSGELVDINPACFRLLGYTREELLSMNAIEVYARPADRDRFRQAMIEHGSVRDFEVKFRKKNGQEIDVLMTATLWQALDGKALWFQGIIRDFTAQKQAEQERLILTAIQRELEVARDIQQSLLPAPKPAWSALDVVCYNLPAREVGGDFYTYHTVSQPHSSINRRPTNRYVITIGDVSGKGTPAALLMAVSLTLFQATTRQELPPAALLQYLDESLVPYTQKKQQNCALIYTEFSITSNKPGYTMQFVNAGCIPPYIKRRDGTVEFDENIGGFALGQGLGAVVGYKNHTVELFPGDTVILTSDGVVEANNNHGEMLGFDRLMEIVRDSPSATTAEAMLNHLKQAIFAFTNEADQHDDMTMVVIRV